MGWSGLDDGGLPDRALAVSRYRRTSTARREAIELDEEPAIAVRQLDPAPYLASQDDQLMLQRRILRLKPPLRPEWRGQRGKNEEDQRDHRANLADSVA